MQEVSYDRSTSDLFSWYAIYVRGQREASVHENLLNRGYDGFVPQQTVVKRYGKRVKKTMQPLFPGYVFCRLNPSKRLPVLTTPGVVQIVGTSAGPLPVEEDVICGMRQVLASDLQTVPWPYLKIGEVVDIIDGPLSGVRGFLLTFQGKQRLVLSISLLQRSLAVEVDRAWIRPTGSSRKPAEREDLDHQELAAGA